MDILYFMGLYWHHSKRKNMWDYLGHDTNERIGICERILKDQSSTKNSFTAYGNHDIAESILTRLFTLNLQVSSRYNLTTVTLFR